MTLERCIGYSGLLLIIIHCIPFADSFVTVLSILIGVAMVFAATYLRWRNKINRYMHSHNGMMSIPHLFHKLEQEGRKQREHNKPEK